VSSAPTTLASGHLAFERPPARSGRRWWLPALGVGLTAAAIIAFLAFHEPPPQSAATSAPEATAPEATAAELTAADTSAPEATSPTPSARPSETSATTAPRAAPTAAREKLPRPPLPAAPPKPDYATMEEFPE
jgi:hypothetical protein